MAVSTSGSPDRFSAQAKALFARAETFHSSTVQANAARWELDDRTSNQGAMREAAKLGFTGVEVARGRGGLGMGAREKLRVAEILGQSSLSFSLGLLTNQSVALRLATFGSARHRADLLPGLLAGTRFGAIAVSAPPGSPTQTPLIAEREPTGWRLSGKSDWLVNAAVADVFVCYANTGSAGRRQDLASFVVRSSHLGFKQSSPYRLVAGSPLGVGGFELDGYKCVDADMLNAPGDASAAAVEDSNSERLHAAVLVCTAMRSTLGAAVDGIGQTAVVPDTELADAVTNIEAAEALTAAAVDLYCQDPRHTRTSSVVGAAKQFACRTAESMLPVALRHLGREALRDSNPVGRLIAECRVLTELSGSVAEMRSETMARLPWFYTSEMLGATTVAADITEDRLRVDDSEFLAQAERGPATTADLGHTKSASPGPETQGVEESGLESPELVSAVPPMPPSGNLLATGASVGRPLSTGGASNSQDSSAPSKPPAVPPMPPLELKRGSS